MSKIRGIIIFLVITIKIITTLTGMIEGFADGIAMGLLVILGAEEVMKQ